MIKLGASVCRDFSRRHAMLAHAETGGQPIFCILVAFVDFFASNTQVYLYSFIQLEVR